MPAVFMHLRRTFRSGICQDFLNGDPDKVCRAVSHPATLWMMDRLRLNSEQMLFMRIQI